MFAAAYRNTVSPTGDNGRVNVLSAIKAAQKAEAERLEAEERAKEAQRRRLEQRALAFEEEAARVRAMAAAVGIPIIRRHTYKAIERRACGVFGCTKSELRSKRRTKQLCFARHFVMYWCCRLTALSLPHIGKFMGGRDHTTCLHGKRKYVEKRAAMGRYLRQVR